MATDYKKIKTFPTACKSLKLNAKKLLAKWTSNGDTNDEIAFKMLKIFIKAINGEWEADFDNTNQCKYYPFFYRKSKKEGFVLCSVSYHYGRTYVSSRLCYETRDKALHGAKYGLKMYNNYLQ